MPPASFCSAARSLSQEARNPYVSYKKEAVGANTWISPVQPRRSSRCGQSVGQWIRTLEPTRALHIRMADHGADRLKLQFPWPILYLGISETMKCKTRFPGLNSSTAQYVRVSRFGGA